MTISIQQLLIWHSKDVVATKLWASKAADGEVKAAARRKQNGIGYGKPASLQLISPPQKKKTNNPLA